MLNICPSVFLSCAQSLEHSAARDWTRLAAQEPPISHNMQQDLTRRRPSSSWPCMRIALTHAHTLCTSTLHGSDNQGVQYSSRSLQRLPLGRAQRASSSESDMCNICVCLAARWFLVNGIVQPRTSSIMPRVRLVCVQARFGT